MKKKVLTFCLVSVFSLVAIFTFAKRAAVFHLDSGEDEKPDCTLTNKFESIEFNSNATYKYDCECDQGVKGVGLSECD